MRCPFRLNKVNMYTDMETVNGTVTVLESVVEEYPECYEDCACRRWSVDKGGYYCAQAALIDDNLDIDIDVDEEE